MDVELTTLGFLMSGPKTGYTLKAISSKMMMLYSKITLNQIYPTLRKLESAGYVAKEVVFQTGKPNKHVYTLTPEGKDFFFRKMTDQPPPFELSFPFFEKIYFFRFLNNEQIMGEFEKEIQAMEEIIGDITKARGEVENKADDHGKFIFKTTLRVLETLQQSYREELDSYRKPDMSDSV
ncbi:MAG: PadR family transcriptional regulator [Desulfatibacillum sp.]|nr:PadR family transcriptional regulator [Desulfatibacillum sp.]